MVPYPFAKPSLARKIILGYSIVVGLAMASGGYAIYNFSVLNNITETVLRRDLVLAQSRSDILEHLIAEARNEAKYFILKDPDYLSLFRERGEAFDRTVKRMTGMAAGPDERGALDKTASLHAAYAEDVSARAARLAEGKPVSLDEVPPPVFEELYGLITTMISDGRRSLDAAVTVSNAQADRARQATILAVVLAGLASSSIALVIVRSIHERVRKLDEGTRQIASGNFAYALDDPSPDELGSLARSFNQMAEKLGELDRMKADFVSCLSHELRSPLTSLKEATSLMQDQVAGPVTPKQERLLKIIEIDADKLLRLINDLLDLSKMEAGMMPLNVHPARIEEVLKHAVQEIQPLAVGKGIHMVSLISPNLPVIRMDELRIQQVVTNLLHNAVKFTEREGTVTLSAAETPEGIRVSVKDTGRGIPPEAQARIFDKFHQVDPVMTGASGGTGLGLPIARHIVEAHRGRIWVESHPGGGASFAFVLPVAHALVTTGGT